MKTILCLMILVAQASVASTRETWIGNGSLFNGEGKEVATYNLTVENLKKSNQIESNVSVSLPDGTLLKHQCLMTETSQNTWSSVCDHGVGGGSCFGEGLCISYTEDSKGKAYATTILLDDPTNMRLLRTELQNGKAVRFFREKLHKQ